MILLAWARDVPLLNKNREPNAEPKVLALSSGGLNLTLIQDLAYEIVISKGRHGAEESSSASSDRADEESLRMVVINENGDAKNLIKLDQDTLATFIGAPLPTLQITKILKNLKRIFKNIRRGESSDARQIIEMAKVAKNMDELSQVLAPSDINPSTL